MAKFENYNKSEIKILGESLLLKSDYMYIYDLKFLKDNPRVYACTHGDPSFVDLIDEQQQEFIYKKLLEEQSVKNLEKDIERHGGLLDNILVRYDTYEVIEGNSRLAVFRKFHIEKKSDEWEYIPCNIVKKLTDDQLAAYLNQIHVKGKTQWSAYEKANFAYVRYINGLDKKRIANLFGETESEIAKRVDVIESMKSNYDNNMSHFSYYDACIRNGVIVQEFRNNTTLKELIWAQIKQLGLDEANADFTAQELRKKLPAIINKPKVLKKFIDGKIDLDGGFEIANINSTEKAIDNAKNILSTVKKRNIEKLDRNQFNALKQKFKILKREMNRIDNIIEQVTRDD